ncbi:MAG: PhoX family phosphatase [Burkholderiaceae bacterium]|nr:PhoX family phosphatase [Burkholderiaceae bacterium]
MNQQLDTLERDSFAGQDRFEDVAARSLARRDVLRHGTGVVLAGLFGPILCGTSPSQAARQRTQLATGFSSLTASTADTVRVPPGYQVQVVFAWGDPIDGIGPAFLQDGSNSAADQARQAGMHHDGGHFFSLPDWKAGSSTSGLWAVNHEYVDPSLLIGSAARWGSAEGVAKSKAAHGVSVVELARDRRGRWALVKNSRHARRITADSEIDIGGPARGDPRLRTPADPDGVRVQGTVGNCAAGFTPWGTYLTCEENFGGVFGSDDPAFRPTADQRRYGLSARGAGSEGSPLYPWWKQDPRFDLAREPNEPNRFGYVVEIDPHDPGRRPVKRTAMGRFKHENCEWLQTKDGRLAFYMGCDEANEYLYKFVTDGKFNPKRREANRDLLDHGTLHVAKFNDDGSGVWLELLPGRNGLTGEHGWTGLADIAIRTRQAADRAGATMMDRPEWVAVNRRTNEVFVTLTNNARRGATPASANAVDGSSAGGTARPPTDRVNPRANNVYGHIVRWTDDAGDAASRTFRWNVFVLAGDPEQDDPAKQGSMNGDAFGCPDGLWIDDTGTLWIQTDVSPSRLATSRPGSPDPDFARLGNNQMLMADPATGRIRRFLTGPVQCEVTGAHMTPDRTTMFVNIQHPGEAGVDRDLSGAPTRFSSWPDGAAAGRPRSATIAITRLDGGTIGS